VDEMKYEGKFRGISVYSDPECPPGKIYFISEKLTIPPGVKFDNELERLIEKMIDEVKIQGGG
jgi:hypothetical protein